MRIIKELLKLPGARSSVTVPLRRAVQSVLIRSKWRRDKKILPLADEHWDLYKGIHQASWLRLQEFPNLVDCRDYNDRIQWLKLFDQDPRIVQCADKLGVRDYIRERTGDRYLTELYQVTSSFGEIDFDALPKAFVIKATHDSASAVLVRDKVEFDRTAASDHFARCLARVYAELEGEWAYAHVPPRLMVEEFINPQACEPPCDYRFHCVNGEIRWIQNDVPFKPKMKEVTVDPSGRPMGVHFSSHKIYSGEFARPAQWEEMSDLARTLSSGWKYIRIDMFVSSDRIFAGEMTFFPYSGFYKGEGQKKMGSLLDFDRSTFREPVYKRLAKRGWRMDDSG